MQPLTAPQPFADHHCTVETGGVPILKRAAHAQLL